METKAFSIPVADYENKEKYHQIIEAQLQEGWSFYSKVYASNIVILQFKKDAKNA